VRRPQHAYRWHGPWRGGALAVLVPNGTLQALCDTPTLTLKTTRGPKQADDLPGLVALLAPYAGRQSRGIIEEAHAMPGHGTRSMVTLGLGCGVWLGVLDALGLATIPASALTSGNVPWGGR
jgi:hypothetical protein